MADAPDPKAAPEKGAAASAEAPAANKDDKKQGAKPKIGVPVLQGREIFFFRAFLLLFTLLIVDLIIVHPVGNYIKHLDESIQLKEQVIPKRLLILKHKNRILGEYRALEPFFVKSSLTQEEETAQFLRELERVSKEAHFFISNINPVKINKKSDVVYELSLDVEGKGGLKESTAFMRMIESSNASMRISAFNLKPQGREADELKALISIVKLGVKNNPSAAKP